MICSTEVAVVDSHELAHAWIHTNVDEGQRRAFISHRGLDNWNDQDEPWNERGAEWAAVVIQQGAAGIPLPPALSSESKSRLNGFELLTGMAAPTLVGWVASREVPCDLRPTELSRAIIDAAGRACR